MIFGSNLKNILDGTGMIQIPQKGCGIVYNYKVSED
jgi:hypothetical protein